MALKVQIVWKNGAYRVRYRHRFIPFWTYRSHLTNIGITVISTISGFYSIEEAKSEIELMKLERRLPLSEVIYETKI